MRDPAATFEGASTVRALALLPLVVCLLAGAWAGWLYVTDIDVSDELRAQTGQPLYGSCPAIAEGDEYEKFELGTGSPADQICPAARVEREDSVHARRDVALVSGALAAVLWIGGTIVRSRARRAAGRLVEGD